MAHRREPISLPRMPRRAFLAITAGGLLAAPLAAEAQQAGRVPVVGVLNTGMGPRALTVDTTRQGLRERGYVEGQTIAFEVRFAGAKVEAFPGLAADLVRRRVDVIVVSGPAGIRAARDATGTIPIVALDLESDPVEAGFARSLAQPGGNITGCFLDQPSLTGKWLELIGDAVPAARRIAVLADPTTGPWQLTAIKAGAEKLRIDLQVLEVQTSRKLEDTLVDAVKGGARALVQLSSPLFDTPFARRIADFTVKHRLPAISMFTRFAAAGGLMAYGPNQPEYYRRLAVYVDKILRGARAADLPIEQPTKFDLVINLKTAKVLGLTIPPSLLQRADQVIE
jgi:putative tryptophan/tyrosine transport system substrate-binding protein